MFSVVKNIAKFKKRAVVGSRKVRNISKHSKKRDFKVVLKMLVAIEDTVDQLPKERALLLEKL